jgi:hypothetical protein
LREERGERREERGERREESYLGTFKVIMCKKTRIRFPRLLVPKS